MVAAGIGVIAVIYLYKRYYSENNNTKTVKFNDNNTVGSLSSESTRSSRSSSDVSSHSSTPVKRQLINQLLDTKTSRFVNQNIEVPKNVVVSQPTPLPTSIPKMSQPSILQSNNNSTNRYSVPSSFKLNKSGANMLDDM